MLQASGFGPSVSKDDEAVGVEDWQSLFSNLFFDCKEAGAEAVGVGDAVISLIRLRMLLLWCQPSDHHNIIKYCVTWPFFC